MAKWDEVNGTSVDVSVLTHLKKNLPFCGNNPSLYVMPSGNTFEDFSKINFNIFVEHETFNSWLIIDSSPV